MGAKEKRERERSEAINKRKLEVINAAKAMFTSKSIETTSMQDIADKAEVGVASVYRYYKNKSDLVYAVALEYIDESILDNDLILTGSGLDKAEQLIDYLLAGYKTKAQLLSFVEQFEIFLLTHVDASSDLHGYNHTDVFRRLLDEEIRMLNQVLIEGIKDGTIRKDVDLQETALSMINLYRLIGQKIAFQVEMLHQDTVVSGEGIKIYKDMMLRYLASA
jgi:AcrR family transcriptional regulator